MLMRPAVGLSFLVKMTLIYSGSTEGSHLIKACTSMEISIGKSKEPNKSNGPFKFVLIMIKNFFGIMIKNEAITEFPGNTESVPAS